MNGNKTTKRLLITALVLALAGAGIWMIVGQRSSQTEIRHVVLISLDTTRADYLSCYGFEKPTTPNIDALAEQGYLFRNAMTPIPLTLPAHASMLTGTIPPHHGKRENAHAFFDPSLVTLASLLKEQGYRTGAFVSSQVMNSNFGLDRGFEMYHDEFDNPADQKRRGEEVNRVAFEWLDQQRDDSIFMFLHYYDPHAVYDPPEPFRTTFKEDPYAGEIAYADHCIGQVIAKLKSLDMYESTLIIVTADHGEMLGEHDELTHGYFIYQGSMKVPMVCRLPGSTTAHEIDDLASIIDIVPTVCDLVDIDPPTGIQGKNLAGYFRDQPPPPEDRYVYCECLRPTTYGANALTGLASTQWKYIHTTRPELYNLQSDPGEHTNLVSEQSRLVSILEENLSQVSELAERQGKDQKATPIAPDLVRHLQSLGYVGEISVEEDQEFDESREDPKDLIDIHNAWREASHHFMDREYKEARDSIEGILDQRPVYSVCELATRIYTSLQDYENAIRCGDMAVAARPTYFRAHEQLAFAYSFAGQDAAAAEHLELTLKLMPPDLPDFQAKSARLNFQLGMTNARLEKFELAIKQFEDSLDFDTQQPGVLQRSFVQNALASALLASPVPLRDPNRALILAKKACDVTRMQQPVFLKTLANALAAANEFDEAVRVCKYALGLATAADDQALVAELQQQLGQIRERKDPFAVQDGN